MYTVQISSAWRVSLVPQTARDDKASAERIMGSTAVFFQYTKIERKHDAVLGMIGWGQDFEYGHVPVYGNGNISASVARDTVWPRLYL